MEIDESRRDKYLSKLEIIRERKGNLEDWLQGVDADELERDTQLRLSVFKAFQELVEAIADICAMYLADNDRLVGDNYENVENCSGDLFSEELNDGLKDALGLRNRLVHEYDKLEADIALKSIREDKKIIGRFEPEVRSWIKNR